MTWSSPTAKTWRRLLEDWFPEAPADRVDRLAEFMAPYGASLAAAVYRRWLFEAVLPRAVEFAVQPAPERGAP